MKIPEVSQMLMLAKPPLKWAGGKRWLVPYLKPLWEVNADRRLVEPFVGGLAVTLGLMPEFTWLNDINSHLINFYKWLARGLIITIPMMNDSDLYYAHRTRFNQLIANGEETTAEAAMLFYYLNRTGYNGLCRFNRRGEFNVPFGKYKTINYTSDFIMYCNVFSRWKFTCLDFMSIQLEHDDFVYADPPYDVEFVQYSAGGFSWDDQVRLAEWLASHHGPIVISNQATDRIIDLYKQNDFSLVLVDAPRRINSTGDRTPAKEVIATRNISLDLLSNIGKG